MYNSVQGYCTALKSTDVHLATCVLQCTLVSMLTLSPCWSNWEFSQGKYPASQMGVKMGIIAKECSKPLEQGANTNHEMSNNMMLYLLEVEQQGEAGRDLRQEHQGLLGDTRIQEERRNQTPQEVLAGFVGFLDTEGVALQFGK